jgi:hypothetical protein
MKKEYKEEFSVSGAELMDKVKKLIHEGNATQRRFLRAYYSAVVRRRRRMAK